MIPTQLPRAHRSVVAGLAFPRADIVRRQLPSVLLRDRIGGMCGWRTDAGRLAVASGVRLGQPTVKRVAHRTAADDVRYRGTAGGRGSGASGRSASFSDTVSCPGRVGRGRRARKRTAVHTAAGHCRQCHHAGVPGYPSRIDRPRYTDAGERWLAVQSGSMHGNERLSETCTTRWLEAMDANLDER